MELYKENLNIIDEKSIIRKEKLNLNLFLSGKLISLLGTFIYNFAVSLYILKVTGSGMSFALSILVGMVPRIVFGPFAGSIADRVDRKKLAVWLDVLSGLTVFGLVGLSALYGLRIPFIYAVNLILSTINTFFDTTLSTAMPDLVRDSSLTKINSYSQAVSSISSILGPVLGGLIFGLVPMDLFLIVNGLSFLVSAALEMYIDFKFNRDENSMVEKKRMSMHLFIQDMKDAVAFMKGQRALFEILKCAVIINFLVSGSFSIVYPFIINNVLKMSSSQYGILEAVFSVGLLAASIVIGKLPEKDKKLKRLVFCLASMGVMLMLMGIPTVNGISGININILFGYFVIIMIASASFLVFVNIPLMVTIQRLSPENMLGRVMGILQTFSGGIGPLGVIIAVALVGIVPPYIIQLVSGGVMVLVSLGLYRNKAMKNF